MNERDKKCHQLALMKVATNLIKQLFTQIITLQLFFKALWTFFSLLGRFTLMVTKTLVLF